MRNIKSTRKLKDYTIISYLVVTTISIIEKYKDHKDEMRERIIKSDKFIKEVSQTFFTMLTDQEFLAITTEVYIIFNILRDLIDKI